MRRIITILLLSHILGDYYFQSEKLAQDKNNSYAKVVQHCSIYMLACFLMCSLFSSPCILILFLIEAVTHWIIDSGKYYICKKGQYTKNLVYIIDQCMHLFCTAVMSYCWIFIFDGDVEFNDFLNNVFGNLRVSLDIVIRWITCLLCLHKPINITIQTLLSDLRVQERKNNNDLEMIIQPKEQNIGRYIGTTERAIMLFLIAKGSLASIGFVLTAKSVARYNEIAKSTTFAEYYLIGTLLSTLFLLICSSLVL